MQHLVQELQAPVFTRRQAATTKLLKLPESAAPELLEVQASATGATAARLSEILAELQRSWFRERLAKLENTIAENAARTAAVEEDTAIVPHAATLRKLLADAATLDAGGDNTADSADAPQPEPGLETSDPRNVLLQILRAEPELFAASLYQPARVPELLEKRSKTLDLACDGREDLPFPTASALALMLVASQPETRLLRSTSANISRPLDDPRFNRLVAAGRHRVVLRKLVSAWILRPGIAADRPLIFAIEHRLPAGREVALRVLQGAGRGPQLYYACMCLAALDSKQDIPLLTAHLKSTQLAWTRPNDAAKNEVAQGEAASGQQVQLRDAALAALIHLQQIPADRVGLQLAPSRKLLYRPDTVGATSDEVREQRLSKYQTAVAQAAEVP
ncbi:MAG: hypothetical protein ACKOEO_16000 [Planctomycetaceae bacterium]